jgi:hypothetical protein
LRATRIGDAALDSLAAGATALKALNLAAAAGGVSAAGVARLCAACTRLTALDLGYIPALPLCAAAAAAAGLPDLTRLAAARLVLPVGAGSAAPDPAAFASLGRLTGLRALDVSVPEPPWAVTDACVSALAGGGGARALEELRLAGCAVAGRFRLPAGRLSLLDLTATQDRPPPSPHIKPSRDLTTSPRFMFDHSNVLHV